MKKVNTRRALLMSCLSLLLCMSMLVGTTFAWFTDSVTSGNNIIKSGTLDIELEYSTDLATWNTVEGASDLFDKEALWEPGYTEVVYLRLTNKGNLALKYQFGINFTDTVVGTSVLGNEIYLSEYLKYDIVDDVTAKFADRKAAREAVEDTAVALEAYTVSGEMTVQGESKTVAMVVYMPETVGNEANYRGEQVPQIDLGVNLFATQLTYEEDSFDDQYDAAAGTAFVGGAGTEEDPYLIDDPAQLLSISEYDEYTYFKVADGVETLDLNGIGNINLFGSFDGNGAKFVNLSTSLFKEVGKIDDPQEIKISNMDVTTHTTNGRAFVRNIFNAGNTIFENVSIHGYIEGQYNMGSFYNYGTANCGDNAGADYTVSFVNAKSDATLVCTTGNAIGGMLGHGYQGSGKMLSVNMDANSGYTGQMYTTGTATCYQVMALCSSSTYLLNGVETSRTDSQYPSTKLTAVAPTVGADGYYVVPVDGADHYTVYLNAQVTAYDENDVKIANLAGMTWNLGQETIPAVDGKVFDLIASAEIINGEGHAYGYELDGDALKIYSNRQENYASGWVTLQVNQYDAANNLLATGIITVYTIPEL